MFSRALDGLSLGEATAASLGLPLAPMRLALVVVLALATGTAVAQTGLIAFVGLAAPHLVRAAVNVTHGRLMLLASLMGGALLAGADLLARGLLAPQACAHQPRPASAPALWDSVIAPPCASKRRVVRTMRPRAS